MKTHKEKLAPVPCICGRGGAIVKTKIGKMISCPDPVKCPANLRTTWHSGDETAIAEWNGLVQAERYRRNCDDYIQKTFRQQEIQTKQSEQKKEV